MKKLPPATVDPIDRTRLAAAEGYWADELAKLKTLPCEDSAHASWWGDLVTRVQAELKDWETERTGVTKPINDDLKRINGEYKKVTSILEAVKTTAKASIARFIEATAMAQAEAVLAAEAAAQAGDAEACGVALAAAQAAAPTKNAGVRTSWKWEPSITDRSQVERCFMAVDMDEVNLYCQEHKDSDTIPARPGLSFKRVAVVAANGKR